jgi:glycopeptide antibiotics resistance protein
MRWIDASGMPGGAPASTRGERARYGALALAVSVFAVYVSLIPFQFRWVPLDAAATRFARIVLSLDVERTSRTNYLANVLLFVPIGFGWAGALLLGRCRPWRALVAAACILPVSLAVSLTAEFLQTFVPGRIVSRSDVTAHTLGSLAGIGAWLITGEGLTGWLRAASDRSRGDRLARALTAYAVLWALANLAPFDFTVDFGALARRVHTGLISVVPFANQGAPAPRVVWDALAAALGAAPLGAWGLVGWTGARARRRASAAFALGAAAVLLVEGTQVFIRSHAADVDDVIFGTAGVAVGVWLGTRALSHREAVRVLPASAVSGRAVALLVAWGVLLCAYHWLPYDFTLDTTILRQKLARMSLVPFVGYWPNSELAVLDNLLASLALAAPFGVIGSFVVRRGRARHRTVLLLWVVLTTVAFAVIEAGQLLLPSRNPDPTDVLVSVAGSLAGFRVGRWLSGEGGRLKSEG